MLCKYIPLVGKYCVIMLLYLEKINLTFCVCFSFQYYFTVLFGHEGQKPLELRCEEEQDGKEWMEAIHQARCGVSPPV